jgi:hypothetical protein
MAKFSNPTDLLGYAVEDQIILRDPAGGLRQDPVEVIGPTGRFIPTATKMINPRSEYSATYDIVDETAELTLQFGRVVNSLYMLMAATITMRNLQHVELGLQFMKLSAVNKFNTALSEKFDVVIPAGFGVVSLLGCTVASPGSALEGSIAVSTQNSKTNHQTSGDYQEAGFFFYGGKLTKSISATGVITPPTGALQLSGDLREPKTDATTYALSWIEYPEPAA